ncbi:MAG: efflux RND transporter periplasmic adaptor subunit [Melioribacteraceae bacterium]|nr:efflux RND transporter periplasmic adaptor subunit [Melioribacteraceae bacterium]MCF8264125.1 efflux RND transporter periplasmic adaptor subunit [Melioribacteraceae bacterium]MCF8432045.1 efflux RND transporter periplasmic adaptor subunit [Melioribacteraceae bacterium]
MDRKIEKKKWTLKKISSYLIISTLVGFVAYNLIFSDSSKKLNVEFDRLSISKVENGAFQEFTPVTGSVQPIETFQLDVSEGGRVMKKFVEEGAFLNAGEPIIQLDNSQLRLSIIYNEANVFQQINNLRSTRLSFQQSKLDLQGRILQVDREIRAQKREYETNKKLFEKGMLSENEYLNSKDEFEYLLKHKELTMETFRQDSVMRKQQIVQLEKSVGTLEKNLDITKQQLENLTVKAPISGQLTALNAEIGESISPGENVGQIDKVDSFKVRASIDEHWIARVNRGQLGSFAFNGEEYSVRVKTVFPQVTGGTFQVDLLFDGHQPEGIRRGQTVHVKLQLGELSTAMFIDRGGFYQSTGGQWIFVIEESGEKAVKRKISLGRQNTQSFEVLSGLKKGEKVITSSYDNYGDAEVLIIK